MASSDFLETWPDVNIQRDKTELEIFTSYFDKIDQKMATKSIKRLPERGKDKIASHKFKKEGTRYYMERKYASALKSFTKSLAYAPCDGAEIGLSLASRLTVLFEIKKYKDCLVDIDRILKTKYLSTMWHKIFLCQTKCYLELKQFKKAGVALENAKIRFETAKVNLDKENLDYFTNKTLELEKVLENNVKLDLDPKAKAQPSVHDLTKGENPQFAYASKTVTMKTTKHRGRYVVANADIKKGDVLFVEESYSAGLCVLGDGNFIYCSQCLTSTLTCIPCASCTLVFYCTAECRKLSWETKHRWECASIRKDLTSLNQSLVLGILFRASHTGFDTTIRDARVYGNKQDNYPYMSLLMTHKNDIPHYLYMAYVKVATLLVIYLIHFTDYFDWLHHKETSVQRSRNQLHRMVGGFLLKYLSQVDPNCDQITNMCLAIANKNSISMTGDVIAHALYLSSCLLSHSCMPNAVKSFHGGTKIVKALLDIKKGSEVTINYLASAKLTMLHPGRIKELKERYYLSCSCRICVDQESFFPWLCPRCQGRALPPSEDERTAKCIDCQHVVLLVAYRLIKMQYLKETQMYQPENLNKTLQVCKQIFHPTSPFFFRVYYNLALHSRTKGAFKKALEFIDLALDAYVAIFGDIPSQCLCKLVLERCLTLVNYCLTLKEQNPTLHQQILKQTEEAIDSSKELLIYHVRQEHFDIFRRSLLAILHGTIFKNTKTSLCST